ncbi:hypothetical protein LIER_23103 [Lithospermum erythrorhizon]|uniref:Protein FAR1-RELATED SEQUENCE n=1 Tax=Lithospermum erythrorhizon TaxID=34254 RepID=A0AAV3QWG2_LITER
MRAEASAKRTSDVSLTDVSDIVDVAYYDDAVIHHDSLINHQTSICSTKGKTIIPESGQYNSKATHRMKSLQLELFKLCMPSYVIYDTEHSLCYYFHYSYMQKEKRELPQPGLNVLGAEKDVNKISFTRLLGVQHVDGMEEHPTGSNVVGIDNMCTDIISTGDDSKNKVCQRYTTIGFLRKDLKNYLFLLNKRAIGPGEATVLQSWFRKQASRNGFYYDIQVDLDGAIYSIFWADSIMHADYALFGDFVSFDTTYRTNKSYRPLGVFVGFNHHKTTCIFGVLFYMMEVLRLTNGYQNAIKKLGASATSEFLDQFKHLVKHVDDQFEYTWSLIQEKFFANRRRSNISWLTLIYNSRKQWSSAWVKDNFTAGKRTT